MTQTSEPLMVGEELVREIVDQVWESMLSTVAVPWCGPEPDHEAGAVRAQITLRGDWNGLVRLTCDPGTAEALAAAMLMAGPEEALPEEDVHDAVGEVVNVVGGNVKGALLGETSLGLPQVAVAAERDHAVPTSRCVLDWNGAPVVVEVFDAGALDVPTPQHTYDTNEGQENES